MNSSNLLTPGVEIFYSARRAIRSHASGGNVLIAATILALLIANTPAISPYYSLVWEYNISLQIGDFNLFSHKGHPMTLMQFINDALMAVFFFNIGLEIKREVLVGELSSIRQCMLSVLGALGGMIVPVLIFMWQAQGSNYVGGAAIPMATDIAFSLGVLSLLGSRVPLSLKIFLTTLAVVDDIGGIVVIAVFYTESIDFSLLLYAAALLGLLIAGSYLKIRMKMYYLTVGIAVWFFFLNSGIHSTIAGVLVAFCIPASPVFNPRKYIKEIRASISHFPVEQDTSIDPKAHYILSKQQMNQLKHIEEASNRVISPLQDLEDTLRPFVDYIVVPLFAFANAGICFDAMQFSDVTSGVSLAVILGLVIGKFVGIFLFAGLAILLRLAPMPQGSTWKMFAAVCVLGGIGFTVSLFIANLSFGAMGPEGMDLLNHAKLGILLGSILAGILGYFCLSLVLPKRQVED